MDRLRWVITYYSNKDHIPWREEVSLAETTFLFSRRNIEAGAGTKFATHVFMCTLSRIKTRVTTIYHATKLSTPFRTTSTFREHLLTQNKNKIFYLDFLNHNEI